MLEYETVDWLYWVLIGRKYPASTIYVGLDEKGNEIGFPPYYRRPLLQDHLYELGKC